MRQINTAWLALLFLTLTLSSSAVADEPAQSPPGAARARAPQTRYLILCLDGVGYSLVERMYRRGELPHFHPPSALLATFPSLTDPSLGEMLKPLGAAPSPGYEDYYFDPQSNRMRGGAFFERFTPRHFRGERFLEAFQYHPHPVLMTLNYIPPGVSAWLGGRISLGRVFSRFEHSRKPFYLAYIDASDTLAHLSGERLVPSLLRAIDRNIPRLRGKAHSPVEVIVFSDHGNDIRRYRRAHLESALRHRGLRLQTHLQDARSVVFPEYGLVSSAVLYVQPGAEAEAADALRSVEGVGLVAYRNGMDVVVESSTGWARILRREDHYRYLPATADPLELCEIVEQLRAQGRLDANGYAGEADWWEATQDHMYPDPLRRLWFAFEENVVHSASVVVSLKDGYYVGSRALDLFDALQATHGNLGRAQSWSFVLTTAEPLPRFLRSDQFWKTLQDKYALRR